MNMLLTLTGWAEDSAGCCINFICLCSRSREAQSGQFGLCGILDYNCNRQRALLKPVITFLIIS